MQVKPSCMMLTVAPPLLRLCLCTAVLEQLLPLLGCQAARLGQDPQLLWEARLPTSASAQLLVESASSLFSSTICRVQWGVSLKPQTELATASVAPAAEVGAGPRSEPPPPPRLKPPPLATQEGRVRRGSSKGKQPEGRKPTRVSERVKLTPLDKQKAEKDAMVADAKEALVASFIPMPPVHKGDPVQLRRKLISEFGEKAPTELERIQKIVEVHATPNP